MIYMTCSCKYFEGDSTLKRAPRHGRVVPQAQDQATPGAVAAFWLADLLQPHPTDWSLRRRGYRVVFDFVHARDEQTHQQHRITVGTDVVVLFNTSSPFLLPVEFFTTTSSSAWSILGSKFYRSRSKTSKTDTSKFYSWGSTSSLAVQEPWTGALAAFVCREHWAIFRIGVDALCLQITTWAWRWVGCSLRITSMLRVRRVPCTWSQQSNKPSQVCVRFTSSFHADSAQVDWSESTTILNFRDLGWSRLDGWSD